VLSVESFEKVFCEQGLGLAARIITRNAWEINAHACFCSQEFSERQEV
jgi:hypothetical protein